MQMVLLLFALNEVITILHHGSLLCGVNQVQEARGSGTEDPCQESQRYRGVGQTETAEGRAGPDGGVVGEEEQGTHRC